MLYTGLISFGRGLEQLIEAMSYAPDFHLVLMGYDLGKQYSGTIKRLAEGHAVGDRLHFVDAVPFAEVPLWVAGADAAAVLIENTCLSYYYCMPNKTFEAIMAGVPVIASDFPDMRTLISEWGIGLTVDPHSVADIAQAITALVRDEGTRAAMSNNALEAAKVYHWGEKSKKLLEVHRDVMPG